MGRGSEKQENGDWRREKGERSIQTVHNIQIVAPKEREIKLKFKNKPK